MTMIFVGGSRDIVELPDPVIERIGGIVTNEHGVLIGDAPGADVEIQSLLAGYRYDHVGVFHAGKEPRNNIGDWAAYHIPPPDDATGFAMHAVEDREMARKANFGLMVWDGASVGTFLNVFRLAMIASPCVVYDLGRGRMTVTHDVGEWRAMLDDAGPDTARRTIARMTPDEREMLERWPPQHSRDRP